ncbi:MAG: hypothetical protein U1F43_05005 [Myxococcota bacterium]
MKRIVMSLLGATLLGGPALADTPTPTPAPAATPVVPASHIAWTWSNGVDIKLEGGKVLGLQRQGQDLVAYAADHKGPMADGTYDFNKEKIVVKDGVVTNEAKLPAFAKWVKTQATLAAPAAH